MGNKASLSSSSSKARMPRAEARVADASQVCPYQDLKTPLSANSVEQPQCPFHAHKLVQSEDWRVQENVPLAVQFGVHHTSDAAGRLLRDIGGGDKIREFCTRFYARMHVDATLKQFLFLDDGPAAHAKRLADWIIEKMGGEGQPWTDSGRRGMRQPSHHAAWNSSRRDPSDRGQHFKLDDTRIWMRLHFWAVREVGLSEHTAFWGWYQKFIGHFIRVYESRAPAYVQDSAQWSADPSNSEEYLNNGCFMSDVVGIHR